MSSTRSLAEIVSTRKLVRADAGTDKKTLEAGSKENQEEAKAVLTKFRNSVDGVMTQHKELNADASVKSALLALEND